MNVTVLWFWFFLQIFVAISNIGLAIFLPIIDPGTQMWIICVAITFVMTMAAIGTKSNIDLQKQLKERKGGRNNSD